MQVQTQISLKVKTQPSDSSKANLVSWMEIILLTCYDAKLRHSDVFQHIIFVSASTAECYVNDPSSCDTSKSEVCIFVGGTYRCQVRKLH